MVTLLIVPDSPRPKLVRFVRDERGDVGDYALILAVFALLMLAALRGLSPEAGGNPTNSSTNLTNMAVRS